MARMLLTSIEMIGSASKRSMACTQNNFRNCRVPDSWDSGHQQIIRANRKQRPFSAPHGGFCGQGAPKSRGAPFSVPLSRRHYLIDRSRMVWTACEFRGQLVALTRNCRAPDSVSGL